MMIEASLGQQIVNGLTMGCMYALIALGYTLIFGVMRLIFFAQGDLCMVGAFAALGAVTSLSGSAPSNSSWLFAVALVAATASAVFVGLVSERLAIRPLLQADRTKQLIASLGVSMILQNLCLWTISTENLSFPNVLPAARLEIGTTTIGTVQIFVVGCSLFLMAVLQWFLHYTQRGLRLRAMAESPATAELDGINVTSAMRLVFIIGSVLAGITGVMIGAYDGIVKYNMGFVPGIKGFTAAILGGFGQPRGAMLGGLVLGLAETLAAGYVSSTYKDVLAFAILVSVVLVRPRGLISD